MEPLLIEETEDTPKIDFNPTTGVLVMQGRSLPDDSISFYEPVIKWLSTYVDAAKAGSVFKFNLDYYNSTSARFIYEILLELEKIKNSVNVEWHYVEGDETIKSKVLELNSLVDIEIALVEK